MDKKAEEETAAEQGQAAAEQEAAAEEQEAAAEEELDAEEGDGEGDLEADPDSEVEGTLEAAMTAQEVEEAPAPSIPAEVKDALETEYPALKGEGHGTHNAAKSGLQTDASGQYTPPGML